MTAAHSSTALNPTSVLARYPPPCHIIAGDAEQCSALGTELSRSVENDERHFPIHWRASNSTACRWFDRFPVPPNATAHFRLPACALKNPKHDPAIAMTTNTAPPASTSRREFLK